jgi:predicted CoA-binding protein
MGMPEYSRPEDIRRILTSARTIAVLGAHPDASRPASYVPAYLHGVGYRVIPVNPAKSGMVLWGEPVSDTLAELTEPVDIVDVFRRSDQLMPHLPDILAMSPRPALVWLQQGIYVVQDRCTLAEHRRLGIPARDPS